MSATTQEFKRQLFGTDGIRGVAGEYPLDRATVYAIGRALGQRLAARDANARVLIGQDTRESSAWISQVLATGLEASRVKVASAGVITTPGVAYLTRANGYAAGIVISASHNPWHDNGIKVFGADGYKLSDELEHAIEADIFSHVEQLAAGAAQADHAGYQMLPGEAPLRAQYAEWLASLVGPGRFGKLRVLVDCANGAASVIAPLVFRDCDINADFLHTDPNGRNINANCGALYPEHVAGEVARSNGKYDLGITFDGDADRALFSDASGKVVNGDGVLLMAARDMKAHVLLHNDTVVSTTMSNMGLEAALKRSGIRMLRAAVGDKYVLEEMINTGASLGGEQSGHILFRDMDTTTGDGILTALRVMEVMARSDRPIADLVADMKVFPQRIENVKVREKLPMEQLPAVTETIRAAERELDGNGRVVVRYSGTEKLARVMVEAESDEAMERHVNTIAAALQKEIGI
ncbi:MAG TPA: phosphoglucosamine mutase [Candidatus Angelobacter sp.]|nr:phosphoglucosamine mutase [Candidatus Angelobacter sp.]